MEANAHRDPDRPQNSESNRNLLPPPGNQQSHRITNFYIDNILRPDFGLKRKDGEGALTREGHSGTKASKPGDPPQRDGTGREEDRSAASEPPHSDSEARDRAARTGGDRAARTGGDRAARTGGEDRAAPADKPMLWPAWVYCTRYSDRPSSGPRSRKPKKAPTPSKEDKRPRTAFTVEQLHRLKTEFQNNRYLTEQRRQSLARDLGLNESQIKIWFQNKRAKIKKATGNKNSLALHLMAQGLYNHSSAKDGKSDSE